MDYDFYHKGLVVVAPEKIKYLEMIQNIIFRMASNSFLLKGWAVTLAVGTFVFASNYADRILFFAANVPISIFWFLDAYYLQQERKYRVLYNNALGENGVCFDLKPPNSASSEKTLFYQSFVSRTIIGFYLPMTFFPAAMYVISCFI